MCEDAREASSGQKAIGCLLGLAVLAMLIVGYFVFMGYAPWLLINPITRHLYSQREATHGTIINLIPEVFSAGDNKADVIERLKEASFEPWPMGTYGLPGTEYFHITAGGNLACGYDFFVTLRFDPAGHLIDAKNERSGACL